MPVNSCVLTRDLARSTGFARESMELWGCAQCGFFWNARFDPHHVTYDESYEATQAHSGVFRRYLQDTAARWLDRMTPPPRSILEVGCGQGEFLEVFATLTPAELAGYDPAYRGGPDQRGIVPKRLPRTPHARYDLVINRMTLEHIETPAEFLLAMAGWMAPNGMLITQVPDATRTLHDGRPCDLFCEHVNYFTPQSLAALHHRTGFEVLETETTYGGQNLTLFARKGGRQPPEAPRPAASNHRLLTNLAAFGVTWQARLEQARATGQQVWIWGTGSRATTFMALLPDSSVVEGAIDINPDRRGTFVLGTPCLTHEPEVLAGRSDLAIIVMNPIYTAEIRTALARLDAAGQLLPLDQA